MFIERLQTAIEVHVYKFITILMHATHRINRQKLSSNMKFILFGGEYK
jgi:hypothetical protein